MGGLEVKLARTATRWYVDRRMGGLEVNASAQSGGDCVDRRMGGLEDSRKPSSASISVDRRMGGLEVKAIARYRKTTRPNGDDYIQDQSGFTATNSHKI